MSPLLKNLGGILVALTLAYVGYSIYTQNSSVALQSGSTYSEQMVIDAQVFIERRATLDRLKIETGIFSDPVFNSYKSFSTPVQVSSVGRSNPFDIAEAGVNRSNF